MLKKILAVVALMYAAFSFAAAVDVNKASAAELDGVKGVGPALSGRILDERKKGSFKDWSDFIGRTKGVGEGTAAKLSAEGLTVNGDSFKGAPAKATAKASAGKDAKKAAATPSSTGSTAAATASAPAAVPAPAAAKTPAASSAKK